MTPLRIGILGAGGAARGIHLPGFQLIPGVEVQAICDPNLDAARATGIADITFSAGELLSRSDIDAVVIATPNDLHRDLLLRSVAAGKHVLCEKPLALNFGDAHDMLIAASKAGVVHMTAFTYRYTPALQYMKQLVDTGALGKIRTVRSAYLMALSGHLLGWRSTKSRAGSGVLADIGSHLIHMTELVAGEIASLCAMQRKFRDDPSSDVEDWFSFLAEMKTGAVAVFEISRVCAGRGAGISEDIFLELYGDSGSACFALQDPWGLRVSLGEAAKDPSLPLQRVAVPDQFLKLEGSPRDIHAHDPRWGYRFDQAWQFVDSIRAGQSRAPSLADGVRCQAVLDAALISSESRAWVNVT